jgi:hypothetical protein
MITDVESRQIKREFSDVNEKFLDFLKTVQFVLSILTNVDRRGRWQLPSYVSTPLFKAFAFR